MSSSTQNHSSATDKSQTCSSANIKVPAPAAPLIAILGATGTGKSALAVSLARRFNGEIINADAMQMYRGLPIITNKIPLDEQEGVPHHMLDFIALEEPPWTVNRFVAAAKRHVEDIRSRGKLPIVVGGTGYYVHGLLMKTALLGETGEENQQAEEQIKEKEKDKSDVGLNGMTVEEMYAKLQQLDPEMARTWHPRDKRRIERSLEICLKTGRKASDWYKEQQAAKEQSLRANQEDEEERGGEEGSLVGLQYDTLLLWLEAEDAVLKERLNTRVDAMVRSGLFDEVLELHKEEQRFQGQGQGQDSVAIAAGATTAAAAAVDKTKGIWQSIGYKELEHWAAAKARLSKVSPSTDTPPASITDSRISKLAADGIEGVKAGTRQYAKRQNRYMRNRFASALKEAGALDRLFLIDSTDVSRWSETVVPQSEKLVTVFLNNNNNGGGGGGAGTGAHQLPDPASLSDLARETFARILSVDKNDAPWHSSRVAHYCHTCEKTLMGDKEWEKHLTSRSHKNVIQGQRKKAARDAYLASRARRTSNAQSPP